jgi:hypothetical protein
MNRRKDSWTAEKVDMGLLTRAAFNTASALRYAVLAGLRREFFTEILERPADRVRQYQSAFARINDRRTNARSESM